MCVYFDLLITLNGLLIPTKLWCVMGNHYISHAVVVIVKRVNNTKYTELNNLDVQRDMSAYGVGKQSQQL